MSNEQTDAAETERLQNEVAKLKAEAKEREESDAIEYPPIPRPPKEEVREPQEGDVHFNTGHIPASLRYNTDVEVSQPKVIPGPPKPTTSAAADEKMVKCPECGHHFYPYLNE